MHKYPKINRDKTVCVMMLSEVERVGGVERWTQHYQDMWNRKLLRAGLDLDIVEQGDRISGPVHTCRVTDIASGATSALSSITWLPRRPALRWAAIVRGWGGTLTAAVQVPPKGYPTSLYAWRDAAECEGLTSREPIPPLPEDYRRGCATPLFRHRIAPGYARLLCREILDDSTEAVLAVSVPQ